MKYRLLYIVASMGYLLLASGCQDSNEDRVTPREATNLDYEEKVDDILNEIEQEEFNFQTDGSFGNVSPYLIIEYNEAKEKLSKIRPLNLDQAKRISGITPADLALVLAHMESKRKT